MEKIPWPKPPVGTAREDSVVDGVGVRSDWPDEMWYCQRYPKQPAVVSLSGQCDQCLTLSRHTEDRDMLPVSIQVSRDDNGNLHLDCAPEHATIARECMVDARPIIQTYLRIKASNGTAEYLLVGLNERGDFLATRIGMRGNVATE